jgi:hypothetical protein
MAPSIISRNPSRIHSAIHKSRRFSNNTMVEMDYKLVFRTSILAVVADSNTTVEGHLNWPRSLEGANR